MVVSSVSPCLNFTGMLPLSPTAAAPRLPTPSPLASARVRCLVHFFFVACIVLVLDRREWPLVVVHRLGE